MILLSSFLTSCALLLPLATTAEAGINEWSTGGPFGGNIRALALAGSDRTTILAGTNGSGVFRSQDEGASWLPSSEGLHSLYIRALATDYCDPNTLYLGATVWYLPDAPSFYKSEDSGMTWVGVERGLVPYHVLAIAADPDSCGHLFIGTSHGVMETPDGGVSWKTFEGPIGRVNVASIVIDPQDSLRLWVGTNGHLMFTSDDGGEHWSEVDTGDLGWGITALAVIPGSPGKIIAGTDDGYGPIFSEDGGQSWRLVGDGLEGINVFSFLVDPDHNERIFAGTSDGVYASNDAGISWVGIGPNGRAISSMVSPGPGFETVLAGTFFSGLYLFQPDDQVWHEANSGITNQEIESIYVARDNSQVLYAGSFSKGFIARLMVASTGVPPAGELRMILSAT